MQLQCLSDIEPTLQGNTVKQKNPHPRLSLSWATWIIARLGGWSGYCSQLSPGMPTIVYGLQCFEAIFLVGFCLTHDLCVHGSFTRGAGGIYLILKWILMKVIAYYGSIMNLSSI